MMGKRRLGLLTAIALSACGQASDLPPPLDAEARAGLDLSLNDASSARLRDVRAVISPLDGATLLLCGLVNSKNRMAAYTGWRRFVVQRSNAFAVISPDADDNSSQQAQAQQVAFEAVYPADRCATSGYFPAGIVAKAIKAGKR